MVVPDRQLAVRGVPWGLEPNYPSSKRPNNLSPRAGLSDSRFTGQILKFDREMNRWAGRNPLQRRKSDWFGRKTKIQYISNIIPIQHVSNILLHILTMTTNDAKLTSKEASNSKTWIILAYLIKYIVWYSDVFPSFVWNGLNSHIFLNYFSPVRNLVGEIMIWPEKTPSLGRSAWKISGSPAQGCQLRPSTTKWADLAFLATMCVLF